MLLLEAMGIALWSVLGLGGVWLLLTGRRTIFGLPKGIREGWRLRAFGALYFLFAAFLIFQASRGSFSPDAVVFAYAFFGVALVVALTQRQKHRAGRTG
jgi:hypothetical protein